MHWLVVEKPKIFSQVFNDEMRGKPCQEQNPPRKCGIFWLPSLAIDWTNLGSSFAVAGSNQCFANLTAKLAVLETGRSEMRE